VSFLDECKAVKFEYRPSAWAVLDEIEDAELVKDEVVGTTRWAYQNEAILKRGDEYVAMEYDSPATEYQDDDYDYSFYAVEPYERTITDYRPI
jgi:hypothetical protein